MGNNKGRSKGCRTCLQRRVKCDQSRPICTRCSKGDFTCLGYRETLFIDGGVQVQSRLRSQSILQSKKIDSVREQQHLEDPVTNSPGSAQPRHRLLYHQGSSYLSCLSASPWKDEIVVSYLVANLGPLGTLYQKLVASNHQIGSSQHATTKQCFLALATTLFGIGHADESIVADGRRLYSPALTMVNAAISESSHHRMTETLSSVAALSLYEAIAPTVTSNHTWVQHIRGLEYLFAAHGPITDTSDPLVKILINATRLSIIIAALYSRQPCLLSQPEWTVSNIGGSVHDCAFPYLLDALAQLPTLYSELDALIPKMKTQDPGSIDETTSSNTASLIQSLLDRSLSLLDDVCAKRTHWMESHPNSEFPGLPGTPIFPIQPCPYPIVTHFSSLDVANAFTLYNCLLVLVNQFIISAYQLLPTEHRDALAEGQALEQVRVATVEILKSIDYHLLFALSPPGHRKNTSESCNFYLLFPMRVAFKVLSQSESPNTLSQISWLKSIFDVIKRRAGPWASNGHIFKLT